MLITVKGTLWGSTDVRVTKKELSQTYFYPLNILISIQITIDNILITFNQNLWVVIVIAAPWSANHSDRSGDERCKQADFMEWRLVSYYLSIKSKFLYAVSYVMVPVPGIFCEPHSKIILARGRRCVFTANYLMNNSSCASWIGMQGYGQWAPRDWHDLGSCLMMIRPFRPPFRTCLRYVALMLG